MSEAVVAAVDDPAIRFERTEGAQLKGITERVPLFRAVLDQA